MTEAEETQRRLALATFGGICEVCGKPLTSSTWQGAHRIANTKANRAKFGDLIMDHPLNIAIVCSLRCNDHCNIGNNPGEAIALARRIYEAENRKYGGGK